MPNFIAGVATVDMFKGDQLIASAKTLMDSSISLGSSNEEVRGGIGNALYGKYYHTSTFDITLTDIMFKLEYIAFQTGSTITNGADIYDSEQVTIGQGGAGTVSGTPASFGNYGTIGWASKPGSDLYSQITFEGKDFTIANANEGDIYCVKYVSKDISARQIVVSSAFVPDTVRLVMTGNLYSGSENTNVVSAAKSATIAGKFQVEVPRFQFSGTQEISMTASGVANTPLTGSALANDSISCDSSGYYAIISEKIYGTNWYDNIIDIAVAGGEIELAVQGTETLVVKAIPASGSAFTVSNSNLTFTSKSDEIATVDETGKVTAIATGSTAIIVTIADKPGIEGVAYITVTA